MRNKKVRFVLVFVLVCLILSLSSCKRNNKDDSLVSSLISSNNSNVDPLVIVDDPNAGKETGAAKAESAPETESSASSVVDTHSTPYESAVTETVSEEKVEVAVPDSPTVVVESQQLYVVEDEIENALLSDDVALIDTTFSYKGIEARLYVFSTFARIILPEGTTDEDIALSASLLCSLYPEETKYISYERTEGCLVLLYPRCDKEYLENVVDIIFEVGRMYIDSLTADFENSEEDEVTYSVSFTLYGDVEAVLRLTPTELVITRNRDLTSEEFALISEEALKVVPELNDFDFEISENGVSFTFERLDSVALSDLYSRIIILLDSFADDVIELGKEREVAEQDETSVRDNDSPDNEDKNTVVAVEPLTKKGRKVLQFEAGINGSVYYDLEHNQLRATAEGRLGYYATDKFSFGVKGGYDWGNYVSVMGYLEYNVTKKIYLFTSAGYKFDLDESTSYSSFVVEAGVGFEHNITSALFVFGELGVRYALTSYSKLTPILSLGFNYKFSF